MSLAIVPTPVRRFLQRQVGPLLDQRPGSRLIRQTAREQWKLLAVNLGSSLIMAFSEGATLAVIYLAVAWLSHNGNGDANGPLHWSNNATVAAIPGFAQWMDSMPQMLVFVTLMTLALLLQIFQGIASYLSRVSISQFSARCKALITARIHRQILAFSYPCASRYRVGDLSDYISQGPMAVSLQIELLNQILVGALLVAMYLVVLLKLSPWLMVTAILLGGAIALLQKRLLPSIRHQAERLTTINVEVSSRIIEDVQGLRLLHSTGQLEKANQRLQRPMQALEQTLRRRARLMELIDPISKLMPVVAFVLIASISLLVFRGRSVGVLPNLVTFMLALQRLNARLSNITISLNVLTDNSGNLQRINQILETSDKEFRRIGGTRFEGLKQEIRLEHVGLSYASNLPAALQDISITIPRGHTVALVGGSGAGKSSIADLLVGLYAPTSGRILIDGTDLNSIDLSSWQQHLGVVSQDTFLFNASVAENIAFGCPWATKADVAAAAAKAQAASFIAQLDDGYDTKLGERGYRLSGGQRQRLSLARAILRNPDLLILDEATSALDSESERLVQQAIEKFEGTHSVLVIAHRLSTVMNADQIVVLEQGRIVERGSHKDLVRAKGRYADLWKHQTSNSSSASALIQPV